MNMHLKLSGSSGGRIVLHLICIGRCLALKAPARRAHASFHWRGTKREPTLPPRLLLRRQTRQP